MSDFPGGGADVPSLSNHLGKDNQVWERPWTLGEMRQASANWSLAADSGVSHNLTLQHIHRRQCLFISSSNLLFTQHLSKVTGSEFSKETLRSRSVTGSWMPTGRLQCGPNAEYLGCG